MRLALTPPSAVHRELSWAAVERTPHWRDLFTLLISGTPRRVRCGTRQQQNGGQFTAVNLRGKTCTLAKMHNICSCLSGHWAWEKNAALHRHPCFPLPRMKPVNSLNMLTGIVLVGSLRVTVVRIQEDAAQCQPGGEEGKRDAAGAKPGGP